MVRRPRKKYTDNSPIPGKDYSLNEIPITYKWYTYINERFAITPGDLDARAMHNYTRHAETEMTKLGIPTGGRAGCTYDVTEACLYPGHVPTRVVLRRAHGVSGRPSWRIVYYGPSAATNHRAEETGILRLTLAAEETSRKAERDSKRRRARAAASTPRRLSLVKAA